MEKYFIFYLRSGTIKKPSQNASLAHKLMDVSGRY